MVGALWFLRRAQAARLNRVAAIDLTLVVLISGFVGGRLLHVFYEEPEYYLKHPLRVLAVWNGGFVFFGGMLAAIGGAYAFCFWRREPFLFWADRAALPSALTYALGRIGCFFNGCCYGRRCEWPWAMVLEGIPRHPTQLYASLWEFFTIGILLLLEPRFKVSGVIFGLWLVMHGVGRIFMEFFRDDPRGLFIMGQSLGTWIGLGLVVMGFALLLTLPAPWQYRRDPENGTDVAN